MNIKQFVPGISYVGVNDRRSNLFEGLWPLPYGVTYNSYIVEGSDKVALIDTVETSETTAFMKNLHEQIGDRKVDYLIVNHMEPDHSGSIPAILAAYPDIKIVGNKQTVGMVKGYYHINEDSRFLVMEDDSKLDLGGISLRFYLVPMVHWPETMVTYVEEYKVLFSGDAFGTFGALAGAVLDKDMECGVYIEEMYRYYSNIVGKYGTFVQRALKKLEALQLDYICPTHGPVWHEKIGEVVEIYDRLSKYESEDGVVIIYGSMYGNTAAVAEKIAEGLAEKGVKRIKIHDASTSEMSFMISDAFRYKGLIVGGPTYSMHLFPPVEDLMIALETREVKNKVFATFGSFTWASVVPKKLDAYAEMIKMPVVAKVEMKHSMNNDIQAQIDALVEAVSAKL